MKADNRDPVIPPTLVDVLNHQGVIAYPTEAVFGLGCDPDSPQALKRLLAIKQRPWQKGLILVAASYSQLLPYIADEQLTQRQRQTMLSHWPGPITYVVPANATLSPLLVGEHNSIAVRVSAHYLVKQLCLVWGKPLVSTSANLTGLPPCRTVEEVKQQFGENFPLLTGDVNPHANPSTIIDIVSGRILREG